MSVVSRALHNQMLLDKKAAAKSKENKIVEIETRSIKQNKAFTSFSDISPDNSQSFGP